KRVLMIAMIMSASVLCLSLAAAGSALADLGGCVDSPENPTWILAGIGGAAAGVPWLRAKIHQRRNRGDK
ncbi:MAG: PExPT-CTERM protein, partial [Gammaproteobacteria bacterium]|nr:PExPT-CTERM protein [Gammaproteobacteria bacterium]